MSATKRKSRSESKKRARKRKKNRKPEATREQRREPRAPYASARGRLKVVEAALVAVTCLFLFVPTVVAAIKLLIISSIGDFLVVAWEWGRTVVLILFAAAFLHVSLLAYRVIFDIGEHTRELLAQQKMKHDEPKLEESETEPEAGEDDREESEDPLLPGSAI